LDQIKAYVSSGALRYIVVTAHGFGSFGLGQGLTTGISSWVRANCSPLNVVPDVSSNIYDCARAF
jgi:hypothetical protein